MSRSVRNRTNNHAEGQVQTGELLPATPRLNLTTLEDIRREMARVYRECRNGQLDTAMGTKLVFMLTQIVKVHEVVIIEKRLTELEDLAGRRLR